jgi:hypothetical protein
MPDQSGGPPRVSLRKTSAFAEAENCAANALSSETIEHRAAQLRCIGIHESVPGIAFPEEDEPRYRPDTAGLVVQDPKVTITREMSEVVGKFV